MGAAHRFVQRRYLVVKIVATFVKAPRIQAERILQKIGSDGAEARGGCCRVGLLQEIQKPAGIAIDITNDGVLGLLIELQMRERLSLCPRQQLSQLGVAERLQNIDLRTRE